MTKVSGSKSLVWLLRSFWQKALKGKFAATIESAAFLQKKPSRGIHQQILQAESFGGTIRVSFASSAFLARFNSDGVAPRICVDNAPRLGETCSVSRIPYKLKTPSHRQRKVLMSGTDVLSQS